MENWSILSDNVRYIQHDDRSKSTHDLYVKTLDYWQHKRCYHSSQYHSLKGEECLMLDVDFGTNLGTMRSNYLDMYEGVHGDVIYTNRFKHDLFRQNKNDKGD